MLRCACCAPLSPRFRAPAYRFTQTLPGNFERGRIIMHRHLRFKIVVTAILLVLASVAAFSQKDDSERRAWNRPVKPFRVAGNIYYVGVEGVASYLITTPAGHILLDGGLPETVPHIRESIRQ